MQERRTHWTLGEAIDAIAETNNLAVEGLVDALIAQRVVSLEQLRAAAEAWTSTSYEDRVDFLAAPVKR